MIFLLFTSISLTAQTDPIKIAYRRSSETLEYGISRLQSTVNIQPLDITEYVSADIVLVSPHILIAPSIKNISSIDLATIKPEGYIIKTIPGVSSIFVLFIDDIGAIYALQDIKDHLARGRALSRFKPGSANPYLEYRIIKFNLPWSPYRDSEAATLHDSTCRDLQYWEKFMDMMVDNRFNVLSLWNIHPFPYMIRSKSFPLANRFDPQEMREWHEFWTSLFQMARVRGIQTFIVNWNIAVSPEFAKAYGVQQYSDQSEIVKRYTRECVTQVIEEYPDLTGIGVTLADWMGTFDDKMTPQQREDWIASTFVHGMKAADRPVKFIHRSVLAGDPMAMRRLLDSAALASPALVEIKFNWSHGHSTPKLAITHDYHSGRLDDRFWNPLPSNYRIQWMIRNEDFFILRWGQPDFIRRHISMNKHDYVNGYFIGSEGYIPAVDYSQMPLPEKTWQYAFEKQWSFYSMWGRLLYDPMLPDAYFALQADLRYGEGTGKSLIKAQKWSNNMPLRLASFHRSTWDYTLYSEGFLEPEPSKVAGLFDRSSPFISIDEFIDHETLDPEMLSIPEYVSAMKDNHRSVTDRITPLQLAAISVKDSKNALKAYEIWRIKNKSIQTALKSEWEDVATWAYLGLYFSDKLMAGVALEKFRHTGDLKSQAKAVRYLEDGLRHWDQVISLTQYRYKPVPHVAPGRYTSEFPLFSWKSLRDQVVKDIDLAKASIVK